MPRSRRSQPFNVQDPRLQLAVLAAIVLIAFIAYLLFTHQQNVKKQAENAPPPGTAPTNASTTPTVLGISTGTDNLLLGNPSNATPDAASPDNYLMMKTYYALSYNNSRGIPNWVSWRVTRADLGDAPRKQIFDTDETLPPFFRHVTHRDYSGSGFDRGHLCPHSDRAASTDLSYATFVMTNIIPQAPAVNEKAWAMFEDYCRDLVRREHVHLYIVAGPFGQGGVGSRGPRQAIANGKVVVPAECWKVVVVVPDAGENSDLQKITPASRVIAIDMPNDNSIGYAWAGYRVTPAEIERKTGLHFFTALPAATADALREQLDTTRVAPPHPHNHSEAMP